ncbi:MAG: type I-C CRISPR-associated protein Cas7/Csd2 [Peptoniphilus lacydonensis]|uniref:type I-C CRISPR-associated protein Cas7/Csd2 n=1 Tax=Peptoniphilus TaxID=162289 RepID=UPI00028A2151|nr:MULTISPECIES: type I-C CRISPR-associated protein Cas7/Csd2 [Peptoniphilus]MDU1954915.1 type I-C CRISPR-associated protein Cas7/Csd2 [Peptoniphilus lacydonensis]MDU5274556.1 type I-C CRISPR-associated protein Cas7/Csd2 [Peptoniphilus lacydonensis]MDU5595345.1 type I-C CRISPR-associated protein Cas7/Csd2 [Peptoniphilus rhinitidis]
MINNKIDFIFTIEVSGANPNGDPLTGNMPRIDNRGFGEISDVCLKRKIRNRMQDMGNEIFVKSLDRSDDGFRSLEKRFENIFKKDVSDEEVEKRANEMWIDIRSFGQVFTYQKRALGIRGPVSISIAKSIEPIEVTTMQITKSISGMEPSAGKTRSADTMGTKHFVDYGIYVVNGSVNSYFAEKTGFNEDDIETLKECIKTLFINDISSARPDGSMEVKDIFWFNHSSKVGDVSSGKIKELLRYDLPDAETLKPKYENYNIRLDEEKLKEYEENGIRLEYIKGI